MLKQLSNIGLEVFCIAGGLLSWTGENFRPFCFKNGALRCHRFNGLVLTYIVT